MDNFAKKQRATVQAAIDSGVLNNTNRSHELVDFVAKLAADKGLNFNFADNAKLKETGFALEGVTVNGFVNNSGVTVNIQSAKALNAVVGHEITHVLEGTPLYDALAQSITEYAKAKGEYQSRYDSLAKLYAGVEGANVEAELVADLVGDYLFTDKAFVQKLSTENRSLFKKIWDEVKYLCKVVTAGSKEAKQLEKVKKIFEEAYRAETKNPTGDGGSKYSLMAFEKDGRRFVEIDQDQDRFDGHSVDEYPGIAKEIIKEKFENKVVGIDNKMFVNGAGRSEFAYPSKPITDANLYEAKMRASPELDNLLDAGTNLRNEADGRDGHVHPDAVGGFDHLDTLFKIGNRYFEGRVNIKNIKRGKLFTDVTQIKDVTQAIMSSYGQNPKSQFLRTSSMDSIRNPAGVVNTKNSLSEIGQTDNIAPLPWQIKGQDVAFAPIREDVVTGQNAASEGELTPVREDAVATPREYISLEDYANNESPVWRNVGYTDEETKAAITQETHDRMVSSGAVVTVARDVMDKVEKSFPDLRSMKKQERTPILKEAINKLKSNIRQFLTGLSNQNFEFEVNGKVLEAKLYSTGINEVLEKVTQDKANMLYSTEEIFRNAQYLYSTPDYDGDPNVYRWNYFYTPVQIGEEMVGVRIAVRDLATPRESQIYNWGIKKDASLDGVGRGENSRISHDVSSDASSNNIPQTPPNVNPDDSTGAAPSPNMPYSLCFWYAIL